VGRCIGNIGGKKCWRNETVRLAVYANPCRRLLVLVPKDLMSSQPQTTGPSVGFMIFCVCSNGTGVYEIVCPGYWHARQQRMTTFTFHEVSKHRKQPNKIIKRKHIQFYMGASHPKYREKDLACTPRPRALGNFMCDEEALNKF